MKAMGIVLLFSIMISYCWIVVMRKNLIDDAKKLDLDTLSPSDFCLMGRHMEFENYDPESI
tara:strand:+ start:330 stop:512 length:183 start_codon:yes stop_codon:yes gene_type:complete